MRVVANRRIQDDELPNRVEPTELVRLWQELTDEERELLIPRLLADTKLGTRINSSIVPFTPRY